MNLLNVVRWIHIISGVAWLGEVITVNFVILPTLMSLEKDARGAFLRQVFPRVFKLASVLAASTILSGAIMNYLMTGWKDLGSFLQTRWGISLLIGGALGLLLALFHFFVEHRLEPTAITADDLSETDLERTISFLNIVPKVGMVIMITVILLMMFAARGL